MSKQYTRAEVTAHFAPNDLWIIISGEVYDVTEFQDSHPGGPKILRTVMGKDATKPFKKKHNERILKTSQYECLCIGKVIEEGWKESVVEQKASAPPNFGRFLSWRKKSTATPGGRDILLVENTTVETISEVRKDTQVAEHVEITTEIKDVAEIAVLTTVDSAGSPI